MLAQSWTKPFVMIFMLSHFTCLSQKNHPKYKRLYLLLLLFLEVLKLHWSWGCAILTGLQYSRITDSARRVTDWSYQLSLCSDRRASKQLTSAPQQCQFRFSAQSQSGFSVRPSAWWCSEVGQGRVSQSDDNDRCSAGCQCEGTVEPCDCGAGEVETRDRRMELRRTNGDLLMTTLIGNKQT